MTLFNPFEPARPETYEPPTALTIAGSDSGGGAGAQADLKTFAACGVYGTSVLTLITAQNTRGVRALEMVGEPMVRAQFEAVVSDLPPAAAKTGALGNEQMIALVAELLQEAPIPNLVVDPVMISKHGDPLMTESARRAMAERLMPHALVVTPNRHEAEVLSQRSVDGLDTMKDAAKAIFDRGARNVLVKGSHLGNIVRDIVYDGSGFVEFGADRVESDRVHGSGCTHSAAITARLAHGDGLLESIDFARQFISGAIEKAPKLGSGIAPVNPMHDRWP
jgi:hydroxymethylpyrimidine/phosphomethylpyrimidine kinase